MLADARGAFGNPTSDSARTMITLETPRARSSSSTRPPPTPRRGSTRVLDDDATRHADGRYCGGARRPSCRVRDAAGPRLARPPCQTAAHGHRRRRRRGADPRRALRRPARGGAPRRRPAAHHRRRGHRQDDGAHAAHRPPHHVASARGPRRSWPSPSPRRRRWRWRSGWTSSSPTATPRPGSAPSTPSATACCARPRSRSGLEPGVPRADAARADHLPARAALAAAPRSASARSAIPPGTWPRCSTLVSRAKDEDVSPARTAPGPRRAAAAAARGRRGRGTRPERHLELAAFYEAYQALLAEAGVVDFGDQISPRPRACCATRPARAGQAARALPLRAGGRVPGHQPRAARAGAPAGRGGRPNITVVGDDDQAIYRWRGAAAANLLAFRALYPEAREVVLTENHRSTQVILDAAARLISYNNPYRLEVIAGHRQAPALGAAARGRRCATCTSTPCRPRPTGWPRLVEERLRARLPPARRGHPRAQQRRRRSLPARAQRARASRTASRGSRGLYAREEVRLLVSFLRALANPDDSVSLFYLAASELYRAARARPAAPQPARRDARPGRCSRCCAACPRTRSWPASAARRARRRRASWPTSTAAAEDVPAPAHGRGPLPVPAVLGPAGPAVARGQRGGGGAGQEHRALLRDREGATATWPSTTACPPSWPTSTCCARRATTPRWRRPTPTTTRSPCSPCTRPRASSSRWCSWSAASEQKFPVRARGRPAGAARRPAAGGPGRRRSAPAGGAAALLRGHDAGQGRAGPHLGRGLRHGARAQGLALRGGGARPALARARAAQEPGPGGAGAPPARAAGAVPRPDAPLARGRDAHPLLPPDRRLPDLPAQVQLRPPPAGAAARPPPRRLRQRRAQGGAGALPGARSRAGLLRGRPGRRLPRGLGLGGLPLPRARGAAPAGGGGGAAALPSARRQRTPAPTAVEQEFAFFVGTDARPGPLRPRGRARGPGHDPRLQDGRRRRSRRRPQKRARESLQLDVYALAHLRTAGRLPDRVELRFLESGLAGGQAARRWRRRRAPRTSSARCPRRSAAASSRPGRRTWPADSAPSATSVRTPPATPKPKLRRLEDSGRWDSKRPARRAWASRPRPARPASRRRTSSSGATSGSRWPSRTCRRWTRAAARFTSNGAEGNAVLDLGDQAARWAEKIRNPPSLLDKLGVKPGLRVVRGRDRGPGVPRPGLRARSTTSRAVAPARGRTSSSSP